MAEPRHWVFHFDGWFKDRDRMHPIDKYATAAEAKRAVAALLKERPRGKEGWIRWEHHKARQSPTTVALYDVSGDKYSGPWEWEGKTVPKGLPSSSAASSSKRGSASALEERISREAFRLGNNQAKQRVLIADLKDALGVSNGELHEALKRLQRAGKLTLYREDNTPRVTARMKESAVDVGGFPRHIVYLSEAPKEKSPRKTTQQPSKTKTSPAKDTGKVTETGLRKHVGERKGKLVALAVVREFEGTAFEKSDRELDFTSHPGLALWRTEEAQKEQRPAAVVWFEELARPPWVGARVREQAGAAPAREWGFVASSYVRGESLSAVWSKLSRDLPAAAKRPKGTKMPTGVSVGDSFGPVSIIGTKQSTAGGYFVTPRPGVAGDSFVLRDWTQWPRDAVAVPSTKGALWRALEFEGTETVKGPTLQPRRWVTKRTIIAADATLAGLLEKLSKRGEKVRAAGKERIKAKEEAFEARKKAIDAAFRKFRALSFSEQVLEASKKAEGHGPKKRFIASVFTNYKAKGGKKSWGDFVAALWEEHRANRLNLTRADLVSTMDPALVKASEFRHEGGRFHFVEPGIAEEDTKAAKRLSQGRTAVLEALDRVAKKHPAGALLSVREVRKAATGLSKQQFDREAALLASKREVILHHHDHPASLSERERDELVKIGPTYYLGIVRAPGKTAAFTSKGAPKRQLTAAERRQSKRQPPSSSRPSAPPAATAKGKPLGESTKSPRFALTASKAESQAKSLARERQQAEKRADRTKLAALKKEISSVKKREREAQSKAREICKRARAHLKDRVKEFRAAERARVNQEVGEMRATVRAECAARKARIRKAAGSTGAKRKALMAEERRQQQAIAKASAIARKKLGKAPKPESDQRVERNLPAELRPIWRRMKHVITGSPFQSRTEAFLGWVQENAEEVAAMQATGAEKEVEKLVREKERLEKKLAKSSSYKTSASDLAKLKAMGLAPTQVAARRLAASAEVPF